MDELNEQSVRQYLAETLGRPVEDVRISRLGAAQAEGGKEYGYGAPMLLVYRVDGDERRSVLHTMAPGPFGHQHMADRAAILLWNHRAFNRLPRHVGSVDVGGFDGEGRMVSIGGVEELFQLTEYVEGREYAKDLARLQDSGTLEQTDLDRADALCDYLAEQHRVRGDDPTLYTRHVRQLVGHGECIMGLTDSYPADHPTVGPDRLRAIERRAVDWRWRLKGRTHRLRRIHGDLHPWNILFREGADFSLLDRSRGEFGDPADDIVALTLNYLFQALLGGAGRFEGPLRTLFDRFWRRYLETTGDTELLEVAAPYIAFRGLVMASPVWYPDLDETVRGRLIGLVEAVLDAERFEPERMDDYLDAG